MSDNNGTTSSVNVHDEGEDTLRKFFTITPNLVYDLGLSPHAGWLYGHLKRVCGKSGKCFKSRETLAKETNMSTGMVSKARQELLEHKLITVKRFKDRSKAVEVRIVDIWDRNMAAYLSRHNMTAEPSPSDTNKNPGEEDNVTSTDVDVADANPDQPKEPEVITAQTISASLYDTSKEVTGVRWSKEEFGYHIGRAEEMLSKDDPTLEEIEELPTAFLKVMGYQGQRADAVTALREIRTSRHMEKVQNETQAEKARRREERREALRAEYANKEAPWERSQPKKTQAEMEAREAERQEELRQMAEARSKRRQS